MTHTDLIKKIAELERICFGSEAWSEAAVSAHIENTENNLYTVFERDGAIVGYALGNHVLDEGELFRIGVIPEMRGCKIGAALMTDFLAKQRENGVVKLFLEVRSGNAAAIALYESFGFTEISRRKNYYRNPTEDAVNYMLDI